MIRIIHSTSLLVHRPGYLAFRRALENPEETQRAKLREYLRAGGLDESWGHDEFSRRLPVTTYEDWREAVELRRAKGGERFEPTSGSTSRRKWIPYSEAFRRELGLAASAWIADLSRAHPGVLKGRHYWSISWLPDELRAELESTDDTRVFSGLKQWMISRAMAVPEKVARLATLEQSRLACLAYLAASRDLALLSVWSPTFALEFLGELSRKRAEIADTFATGRWQIEGLVAPRDPRVAALLRSWDGKLDPAFTRELWPNLALVSSWDSSTSAHWARELRALFPHAAFQGKGLWATEGVVSFPFEGRYPAAVASHFLEFRDGERVYPAWKLEKGMKLQPLLTTGSGFFRYALPDRVEVTGFLGKTPCLKFLGRIQGVDLVGEKIDAEAASQILDELSAPGLAEGVSLLACRMPGGRPRYVLLARGADRAGAASLGREVERKLGAFHHYRLARELGQLEEASAEIREDAIAHYERLLSGARIPGSLKIEPLTLVESPHA
jgi:hypothetical protein